MGARKRGGEALPDAAGANDAPSIPLAVGPLAPEVRARLLLTAMEAMRSGQQRGNRSSAMRMDAGTLFGIAIAHLVEDRRLPGVVEAYAADLEEAGVTERVLKRYMLQLRRLYWRQIAEHLRATAESVDMASMVKDPRSLARQLLAQVSAFVHQHMDARVMSRLSTSERHLVMRGFEACTKALDLMANAEFRQVQTEKVREAADRARKAAAHELSRMKGVENKQAVIDLIGKALMGVEEAAS